MVEGQKRYSVRFQTNTMEHQIAFHKLDRIPPLDQETRIMEIFDDIIAKVTHQMAENDKARFHMACRGWKRDLNMPFMEINELTGARVLTEFARIAQSNDNTRLDADEVELNIIHTIMAQKGAGWKGYGSCRRRIFLQLERWLQAKKCAINTIASDNLCLARSLVVALAHYIKLTTPTVENIARFKSVKDNRQNIQGEEAERLHLLAGVPMGPCGLPEVKLFQDYLAPFGYRLHVFSAAANFANVFVGPSTCTKKIALLLLNKHYIVLTKMPAFFNSSAFCWECLKGLNHPERHRCLKKCISCQDADCTAPPNTHRIKCADCLRYFKNDDCMNKHRNNGICKNLRRCPKCYLNKYVGEEHKCGLKKCSHCKQMVDRQHLCFMQRPYKQQGPSAVEEKENQPTSTTTVTGSNKRKINKQGGSNKKFFRKADHLTPIVYYFDYEAMQDMGIHTPNLVVVQQEKGNHQEIFKNDSNRNCSDSFCDWVFRDRCGHQDIKQPLILVAHYFKGYDGYFVLRYLNDNNLLPHIILTGSKIMLLDIESLNIKFIDSINFLPMPLSKFPATFNLSELKKGYFPHKFNTLPNQAYIGLMPDIQHYQPDKMSEEARTQFLQWHASETMARKNFDLQQELKDYCISDVTILREGCQKYRALCLEMFTMDPFVESITIASYCQKVYLQCHMFEKTIAILPHGGYSGRSKQSNKALRWLKWMENTTAEQDIQYAGKMHGEARVSSSISSSAPLLCISVIQLKNLNFRLDHIM